MSVLGVWGCTVSTEEPDPLELELQVFVST